jgi:predicted nuclease with RNAse H fold
MLIAGVDLAAEPKGTALAVIDWSSSSAALVELNLDVSDSALVDCANQVEKLGIDCALGWPVEFIDFLSGNHPAVQANAFEGDLSLRRRLAYRETDRHVREVTGRWPLSVSTDRLGMTAIRCAGLLSQISATGIAIDKSGSGRVIEIYPGASLRIWGFATSGYRASKPTRAALIETLSRQAPWLELGNNIELMVESCDAFDAVIAALAARFAQLGAYARPSADRLELAKFEGWVALPNQPLSDAFTRRDS